MTALRQATGIGLPIVSGWIDADDRVWVRFPVGTQGPVFRPVLGQNGGNGGPGSGNQKEGGDA
jgi:hypothetical protein